MVMEKVCNQDDEETFARRRGNDRVAETGRWRDEEETGRFELRGVIRVREPATIKWELPGSR